MGIISRFLNRTDPIYPTTDVSFFAQIDGKFGVVTSDTAIQHSIVYACNQIIADAIASVTLQLMEYDGVKRKPAKEHPAYQLLKSQPNPFNTSFEWRQMLVTDINLRGNHYSQIVRNKAGQVIGIYPLYADLVDIKIRDNGQLVYIYQHPEKGNIPLSQDEILHIKGIPDASGLKGLNPIEYNRKSLELSMTTEQFGINFFKNGAHGSGILEHPGRLSDEAYERLKKDFEEKYQGLINSGKPIILEEGMKFTRLSITNEDSQFLQTRKYQKAEIAAIFKVPLFMLNDLEKATFNNMEQMGIYFVMYTLMPWAVKIEQALSKSLLTAEERKKYFFKFNLNTLMRGDFKTRTEGYRTMINMGMLSPNEARSLEDLDAMGPEGDEYFMQLNMSTLKKIVQGENDA